MTAQADSARTSQPRLNVIFKVTAKLINVFHLQGALKATNRLVRWIDSCCHRLQFDAEWSMNRCPPEWFDHLIEQHWRWTATRNPMTWERGTFCALAMNPDCRVLDLCCGGGFITYHFYSLRAREVVAVDFDPLAIKHARRNFSTPNLRFVEADIRRNIPPGPFDTIVWNAAIEHFTKSEIDAILGSIRARLTPEGILCGYTIVERPSGKAHHQHEYEFHSKEELAQTLAPFFPNILVFETYWADFLEDRQNLYFFASHAALPFDSQWQKATRLTIGRDER